MDRRQSRLSDWPERKHLSVKGLVVRNLRLNGPAIPYGASNLYDRHTLGRPQAPSFQVLRCEQQCRMWRVGVPSLQVPLEALFTLIVDGRELCSLSKRMRVAINQR
jgi:hypothetical protein